MNDLTRLILTLTASGTVAFVSVAQQTEPEPATEPETPAVSAEQPTGSEADADDENKDEGGLASLDDLLGLDGDDEESSAADDAEALPEGAGTGEIELEKALTQQEARDALVQAAQQMKEASFRIGEVRDTGIVTQRLQGEIISKLDVLIQFAEQQQQQQQQKQQQQQQQQQSQQNQQQQQGKRQQQPTQGDPGDSEREDGISDIPFEQGARDVIDSSSAGWGDLPQRVRDRLVDGSSDYFSTLYEALTEAYYRRLAEEASQ